MKVTSKEKPRMNAERPSKSLYLKMDEEIASVLRRNKKEAS